MAGYLIAHIGHTTKSHEHITWWKPESCGYNICIDEAGRYSEDEARSICQDSRCIALKADDVEPLARTTPHYRKNNGTLGKLYDGGPHRPVPNSQGCWDALMMARAFPPQAAKTDRPTPMPASKARAIYLPAGVAA